MAASSTGREPEEKKPTLTYLKEIEEGVFLNPVTVHYANRAMSGQFGMRLHGFPIIRSTPRMLHVPKNCSPKKPFKLKPHYSSIFYLGSSVMHAPYHVSENLLAELEKNEIYTESTKKIMLSIKHKLFPTVEEFLREWLLKTKEMLGKKITPELHEKIFAIAADFYTYFWHVDGLALADPSDVFLRQEMRLLKELSALIELNGKVNTNYGRVLPINPSIYFCVKDRNAFDKGECTVRDYPLINPTAVYELFQLQKSYTNYIEEKLALGHAVDFHSKLTTTADTQRILSRLVNFKYTSSGYFSANCNTATATFLQEAENISADNKLVESKEQKREPQKITGASLCSIGSDHRMFFWNSRLHKLVIDLFINREYKKSDLTIKNHVDNLKRQPTLLQELADHKEYILQIIETWPIQQYKKALEQILDENTPLGTVFLTRRTGYLFEPHPDHGLLKKAAEKLAIVNEILLKTETKESKDELKASVHALV